MSNPLRVFDDGIPFEQGHADTLDMVHTAALALNRARAGSDVDRNLSLARDRAELAARNLQDPLSGLGSRVSHSQCLALAAYLIERDARDMDPQRAR